jgi:hypothetical protein
MSDVIGVHRTFSYEYLAYDKVLNSFKLLLSMVCSYYDYSKVQLQQFGIPLSNCFHIARAAFLSLQIPTFPCLF